MRLECCICEQFVAGCCAFETHIPTARYSLLVFQRKNVKQEVFEAQHFCAGQMQQDCDDACERAYRLHFATMSHSICLCSLLRINFCDWM